jgi:hypothetical protein
MEETLPNRIVERGSSPRGDGRKCFSSLGSFENALPPMSSTETSSLKSTTNISSRDCSNVGRNYRGNDIRELGTHTSAVINDEPDSNGSISLFEYREFLRLSVFKHAKVLQLQARDKGSTRVSHIYGKQNETGTNCNFRLVFPGGGTLRRERGRETENSDQNQKRRKEEASLARILAAPAWNEDHEEAFSRRGT